MKKRVKYFKNKKNLNEIINNRFNILYMVVFVIFLILISKLFLLQVVNKDDGILALEKLNYRIVEGNSTPRGRIYDRNLNLLVDNIGEKVIYYKKNYKNNIKKEIELAYKIANNIELSYNDNLDILKNFWIVNNEDLANSKITKEEYSLYKSRKLTKYDLEKLRNDRITDIELSLYNNIDKKAAYIYSLMNKGYSYEEKIIKINCTDYEYAFIAENLGELDGFNVKLEWKRRYIYGDVLRGVLGNVSTSTQGVPFELKDYYLNKGYNLNDRVGLSYLEFQYEGLLKGIKPKYKATSNKLILNEEGSRGNDIVLTIDIRLQMEVEKIMEEELKNSMNEKNTEYFNKNFVIISNPTNGEILAYAGKYISKEDGKIIDYSNHIATTPVVVGSVIKGASMAVGYKTHAIDIGTKMLDECIKIASTKEKCSWRSGLGVLDDINALKYSSNSYQFKTAIKVANANYYYNGPLKIDEKAFDTYRSTFKEFGLGVKTEIDLPKESIGYIGKSNVSGHLLDFSIGQYDTYTILQLSQYINTIASNGNRYKLNFLKSIHESTNDDSIGELKKTTEKTLLNKLDLDDKYIYRIKEGLHAVMNNGGLGVGYMNSIYNPSGKTGTAQSFYDSDYDGIIDKDTYTATFAGFAPSDNPKMSIVSISPDVSHIYGISFQSQVNKRITSRATDAYFNIYNE